MTCIIGPIISCMAIGSPIMWPIGGMGGCAASGAASAISAIRDRACIETPSKVYRIVLVMRVTNTVALFASITAAAGEAGAQGGPSAWQSQTVPLWGVSYSPDVGLLVGAGITHTRYGFRALPPSTRLLAEAEYATGVHSYRVDLAGEFRRPLSPSILFVELRASGLELTRFYGTGNETDGSRPDSVYRVRQTQLLLGPRVAIPLAPRLRLTLGTSSPAPVRTERATSARSVRAPRSSSTRATCRRRRPVGSTSPWPGAGTRLFGRSTTPSRPGRRRRRPTSRWGTRLPRHWRCGRAGPP